MTVFSDSAILVSKQTHIQNPFFFRAERILRAHKNQTASVEDRKLALFNSPTEKQA